MTKPVSNPPIRAHPDRRMQKTDAPQPPSVPQRTPEQWRDLISERIEEAMREGKFDNLRGKGKPLNPAPEPYTPPEMQMANSLLKHNELTPAWIADRNVVLAAIEQFRKKVRNGASAHLIALAQSQPAEELIRIEQHWQKQLAVWREEILILNHRIEAQNFKQPVSFLEIIKLRIEDEMNRAKRE
ncbi:DnaJ family domain-containing protein [Caldilinea sp.]|uniref:DnaJ family domain-containing protein n=1 Tax=Caldilinea sp. TaxID=2293560 RepID=UPI002B73C383|nr:DUF1992 domain-containing protein [Anaerolineales bacterium]HQY90461.1 DUF1992 domain-containing protein [Caldilinea sp.]HRA66409.1 DUF1992 domain-containing protein [Caldilinea sp.]